MGGENAKIGLGKLLYRLDRIETTPHQFRELEEEFGIEFFFFADAPFLDRDIDGVRENGDYQGKYHYLVKSHGRGGRSRWRCGSGSSGSITVIGVHLCQVSLQYLLLITGGRSLLLFCRVQGITHQECGENDQQ